MANGSEVSTAPSRGVDQFYCHGTDNRGVKYPLFSGFTHSWNAIREAYLHLYPDVVHIEIHVALPDKEFMAKLGINHG